MRLGLRTLIAADVRCRTQDTSACYRTMAGRCGGGLLRIVTSRGGLHSEMHVGMAMSAATLPCTWTASGADAGDR
eukprot:9418723-Alexandrium_andersonii.AAC.1